MNTEQGISPGRAAEVREAFSAAKLVPEAIDGIDPRVGNLQNLRIQAF